MAKVLAIIETLSFFGEASPPPRPTPSPPVGVWPSPPVGVWPQPPVDPGWGVTPPVDPGYGHPSWGGPVDPGYGRPNWGAGHPSHPIAGGPPVYPSHPIYRPDKPLPWPVPPEGGPGDGGDAGTKPSTPPQYVVVWIPGYGYVLRPVGGDASTKPILPPEAGPKK